MGVITDKKNKPFNPRGNDQSPLAYNKAAIYSGKALDFDGVNDVVTTTNTSGFTGAQEFTYCAYVNADTNQATQAIIHGDENVGWGLQSLQVRTETNGIRFFAGTGSPSTSYVDSETLEPNKWYFVVGTHTPTENKIYLNGVLNGTATAANLTPTPQAITVGAYQNTSSPFNGEITNVKVFNTALTAAQIADLYNNPEKIVPTGVANTALKLWLPMQEGAGTTAYDGSGNGNHGTISGATYVNGVGAPVAQTAVIDWNKGTNLVRYSEDFVTGFSVSNAIISQANITAPDGSNLVRKLVATNSNTFHLTLQANALSAGIYTQSVYAKAEGRDFLYMNTRTDSGSKRYGVKFNIANGTYVGDATSGSPTNTSYSIQNMGNGWFRCSISSQHTSGSVIAVFSPAIAGAINGINDGHQGDGVNGIYIWGGALSQSTIPKPYVYTGATAQTSPVLLPQGLTAGRDITGVNLFTNVRKQGALNLDGNSWAEVHDNASVDVSEFTLEGWVYTNSITSDNRILSKWFSGYPNRTFQFTATNDDLYLYTSNGSSANSTSVLNVLSLNNWYHCVATYDGANLKIYLDGVLKATTASTITLKDSNEPVYIGAYVGSLDPSDNTTAQPRIYNRALTAEEVQKNYSAGKNIYTN